MPELIQLIESIRAKWSVPVSVSSNPLRPEDEASLKAKLRELPPQKRGKIVTKHELMLPLSGSKNLNLGNTPILLVERGDSLVDVFPKSAQGEYFDVRDGLLQILELGPREAVDIPSMEGLVQSRLVADSKLVEEGLSLIGAEHEVPSGFIDLLFKDAKGQFLVLELKREGTDATIGQILRLTASLAQVENVEPTEVRMMIVCGRTKTNVELAAKFAQIEVHKDESLFRGR